MTHRQIVVHAQLLQTSKVCLYIWTISISYRLWCQCFFLMFSPNWGNDRNWSKKSDGPSTSSYIYFVFCHCSPCWNILYFNSNASDPCACMLPEMLEMPVPWDCYCGPRHGSTEKFEEHNVRFQQFLGRLTGNHLVIKVPNRRGVFQAPFFRGYVKQGSLDYPIWRGLKQCKSMVDLRVFPLIVHGLGW